MRSMKYAVFCTFLTSSRIPGDGWEVQTPASVALYLAQGPQPVEPSAYSALSRTLILVSEQCSGDGRHISGQPALIVSEHPEPHVELALARVQAKEQVRVRPILAH